ncbi:thiamine transporter 2-like [Bacillus rossius redtenbacheri]|uniref:thiamine transporter 2-like n=1 Tax=Bacillus rossius redtenbacheri TaxID=93214 RepID=UPI002FDE0B64
MELWIKTSMLLCLFGFLKEFRPSEPYLVSYLTGPELNFTDDQVNQQLFPTGTYTYISLLGVVLLITDFLRYKPLLVVEGIAGTVTWSVFAWGTQFSHFMAGELVWAVFAATEVAYYTYIYARVDRDHYQRVTSHTRAALLLGHSLSALAGQGLLAAGVMDSHTLTYITAGALALSTVWALLLPKVSHSMYFHRSAKEPSQTSADTAVVKDAADPVVAPVGRLACGHKFSAAYRLLKKDLKEAYGNAYVVKWSAWWVMSGGCYVLAYTYNQIVYETILKESGELESAKYNGAVEAISSLLGAAVAFGCGWLLLDWPRIGNLYLSVGCLFEGAMMCCFAISRNIWLGYCTYTLFVIGYQALITIASTEVAKKISEDSYGLIFGVNTLLATLVQTAITVVVVSDSGLGLQPRQQYMVYGGYFIFLGVLCAALFVYSSFCKGKEAEKSQVI